MFSEKQDDGSLLVNVVLTDSGLVERALGDIRRAILSGANKKTFFGSLTFGAWQWLAPDLQVVWDFLVTHPSAKISLNIVGSYMPLGSSYRGAVAAED